MAEEAKEQETQKVETAPEDPALEFKTQLDSEKKARGDLEVKIKDLGARLTRTQQEHAELLRFHKATLPKINKSFEERWDESPEQTLENTVAQKVNPMVEQMRFLSAKTAMTNIIAKNPEWRKYEDRVIELGDQQDNWSLTDNESGLTKLFKLAKYEEMETEYAKMKSGIETENQKSRAVFEAGTPKNGSGAKPKISDTELKIARSLGLTPEDYL